MSTKKANDNKVVKTAEWVSLIPYAVARAYLAELEDLFFENGLGMAEWPTDDDSYESWKRLKAKELALQVRREHKAKCDARNVFAFLDGWEESVALYGDGCDRSEAHYDAYRKQAEALMGLNHECGSDR